MILRYIDGCSRDLFLLDSLNLPFKSFFFLFSDIPSLPFTDDNLLSFHSYSIASYF